MRYIEEEVVGKTLEQILIEEASDKTIDIRSLLTPLGQIMAKLTPVSVYVLNEPDDKIGCLVAEEISLYTLLRQNEDLRQAVVEHYNNFYGGDVFCVRIGGLSDDK